MDDDAGGERLLTVAGERFRVRRRPRVGRLHEYDYDWLSGPNDGYGFGLSGPAAVDDEEHAVRIAQFLAGIDPVTGYLSED